MNYPLIYIDRVTSNKDQFEAKVRNIAQRLQVDPNWLMLIMEQESGLDSTIINSIGCTGLIQFCPDHSGGRTKTINGEVVNLDALTRISNVDQLEYVYKYYQQYAGKINSFEDLYMVVFFPIALGWDDSRVIEGAGLSAAQIANSNPSFDINKDGQVTVGEFKQAIRNKLPLGYKTSIGRTIMAVAAPVTDSPVVVGGIIILFFALIFLLYKQSQ